RAVPAEVGVLHDVFGVAARAEHAIGDAAQLCAMLFEDFCAGVHGTVRRVGPASCDKRPSIAGRLRVGSSPSAARRLRASRNPYGLAGGGAFAAVPLFCESNTAAKAARCSSA